MDALVALGDHRAHALQGRALGGPVARRARAVLLARQHDGRRLARAVARRRVEDRHLLAFGEQQRLAALDAREQLVLEPHVGERAAHHDVVVAAPRAVLVEVRGLHAALLQPLAGRARGLDVAGGRDVVGGDAVAEQRQHACARDIDERRRVLAHAVEVRGALDVGRSLVPGVSRAAGHFEGAPLR